MKRWIAVLAAGLVGSTLSVPAAVADTCRTHWGSAEKTSRSLGNGSVTGLRAGGHACFDRFVVAGGSSALVGYVSVLRADPSDRVVPLAGGARLRIVVFGQLAGNRLPSLPSVAGLRTFRQVAWAGNFEAVNSVGLGVRARLPFRVFTIGGAHPRVVIDVAHHW